MADVITPSPEAKTSEEEQPAEVAATETPVATAAPVAESAMPELATAEATPAAEQPAPEVTAPTTPTAEATEATEAPETPEAPITGAVTSSDPAPAPEVAKAAKPPKRPSLGGSKRHIARIAFEVFLVSIIIGLAFYCNSLKQDNAKITKELDSFSSSPTIVALRDNQALIKKVGGVATLPTGEDPAVATVSDVNKAKAQSAFFNNAQNGDKVLLYVKSGTAILYRPSTNKVINQGPLNITNTAANTTTNTTTKAKQ